MSTSTPENVSTGSVILNSNVSTSANTNYSLTGGDSKFQIDSSTGQVTLTNPLDYETATSHSFTITAIADGESESKTFTLDVDDVTVNVTDSGSPSSRVMTNDGDTYYFSEKGTSTANDLIIADLGGGLPAGTTFSSQDSDILTVDSNGIVSCPDSGHSLAYFE